MPKRQRGNQQRYISPTAEHGIPFEWDEIADHEICRWVDERRKKKPFGLIMRQSTAKKQEYMKQGVLKIHQRLDPLT